jgi:hypothetical protein
VFGVFAATAAIFGEKNFVRYIDLVLFTNIILRFAHSTDKGEDLAGTFFGHSLEILA